MEQDSTIPHRKPADEQQSRPPTTEEKPKSKKDGLKSTLSTLFIIIAAPIIALLLTAFVFQSYEVDGPSMEKTLQDNDRLVVLKVRRTWFNLTGSDYLPGRGEVVVFNLNGAATPDGERQLIKRVIGQPGDRVIVQNNSVTIYNAEFPEGFNPDEVGDYQQTVEKTTSGNVDITVPAGEIFVLGDNRSNSQDSRAFGTVASENIIGTLALRIYPFSKFEVY